MVVVFLNSSTVNIRSFDLWSGVATMTPESHKRVFAVYPEGEQMPFLLQCRDAASFKEWQVFAALIVFLTGILVGLLH